MGADKPPDLPAIAKANAKQQSRTAPAARPEEDSHLRGLYRAHTQGRGILPPPWVVRAKETPHESQDAGFIGLYPARPHPRDDEQPWRVRGLLTPGEDGNYVLSQLIVENFDPTIEVTAYALRRLPVATIRDRALEQLRLSHRSLEILAENPHWKVTRAERDWARRAASRAGTRPLTRGRAGYSVDHYRRIALRAVDLFGKEGRRDVLKVLAAEEDRPYSTVRDWVKQARELGFLEPVKQGRTNFRPGPNLYKKGDTDG